MIKVIIIPITYFPKLPFDLYTQKKQEITKTIFMKNERDAMRNIFINMKEEILFNHIFFL